VIGALVGGMGRLGGMCFPIVFGLLQFTGV
jgi:hypothetical protein